MGLRILILVLLALLALIQLRLWVSQDGWREVWRLEESVETQQLENAALKTRNETLEAEVRDLKEGVEAVEERARSDLGMISKGETFYQVVEEKDKTESGSPSDPPDDKGKN